MRSEANLRKYVVGADDSVCPVLSRGHRSCAVGEAISFPIPCISWQVSYNGPRSCGVGEHSMLPPV